MAGFCAAWLASSILEETGRAQEATTQPSKQPTTQPATQPAAQAGTAATVYKKMSLDELMDVEVTTVTRRESTVRQSPAAISVITQDDIRRSGAMSIPDALRMVPGMEVAQIDGSTWGVTARGFNGSTANKLLVLMDGRSVYTPLFSGVFWDAQDALMQDLDRIEVIRGPAGSLWGANAVNGVINVITKDARDTQGLLVTGGGGTEQRDFGSVRYGWNMGNGLYTRVYVKHFERDETEFGSGRGAIDDWLMTQAGFRMDWHPSADAQYTLQGDMYQSNRNNQTSATTEDTDLVGGNLLARWTQKLQSGGDIRLQAYYDGTKRDIPNTFAETRNTFDIDFQYHVPVLDRHDLTFGLGYRVTADNIRNSSAIEFLPKHRTQHLFSAFVQDEIQLVPDRLWLTLGSKFEHNDFTGFEIQPSARLLWAIDKRQSAWAAVSRAVRTPTRLEEDLRIIAGPVSLRGNRNFQSEVVLAYEAGYRVQPVDWLALDIAAFYNSYDRLRSIEAVGPLNFMQDNKIHGQTYGAEIGSTLQLADWWTIRAANTFLRVQLQPDRSSSDTITVASAGNDPQYQMYLRSSMDLSHNVDLDVSLRYVSELSNQKVPGYLSAGVRLAWRPNKNLELSIIGQNLFDNRHPEFGAGSNRHEMERGVFGMFTYRW